MGNEYETEAAPAFERGERREMNYGCLKCENTIFYISTDRHHVQCDQCFNICDLVLYSCNDCCPSGYKFCPICRVGTETENGCSV